MNLRWPSAAQSLNETVAAHRGQSPEERVRALARLFEFFRELLKDPDRRARWEAGRRKLEEEGRAPFRRLLARGR